MTNSNSTCADNLADLIALQIRFGLSYVQEARIAYSQGRSDYGDLARQVARNAHSAAKNFIARLPGAHDVVLMEAARLENELDALPYEPVAVRSIA